MRSTRLPRMRKSRALMALVCIVAVAGLSGCAILSDSGSQVDQIGNAVVTTEICAYGFVTGSPTGPCNNSPGPNGSYQILLAYQVPSGVQGPTSMTASGDRSETFSFSQGYTDRLEALSPAASGMKWIGYVSSTVTPTGTTAQTETVVASFQLPRGSDGTPFQGPFKWLTVSGNRNVDATNAALHDDRAVTCGPDLFTSIAPPTGDSTVCVNSPVISAPLPDPSTLTTSDFGVMAPSSPQSVQAGQAIDMPFRFQLAGTSVGTPFALSASDDIPSGNASPQDASLSPADNASGTEPVHVTVPASTPAGTYNVTFKAALPNGQTRTITAPLTVTAAPQPPVVVTPAKDTNAPTLTIAGVGHQKLKDALKKGLLLDLSCNEPCNLGVGLLVDFKTAHGFHLAKAKKPVKVGGRNVSLTRVGHVKVRVKFSGKARKRLSKAKKLKLTVQVAGKDTAGNAKVSLKKLTLR